MIDRNKILKGLEACADRTGALCRTCPYDYRKESCISDMADDALELLREQPKQKFFVDSNGKMTPLPIREHGHWKGFTQSRYFGTDDDGEPIFRDGLFYVCSECRRKSIIKHPYCPRCGAKMDEGVKQDG